jgi:hypothetical protein
LASELPDLTSQIFLSILSHLDQWGLGAKIPLSRIQQRKEAGMHGDHRVFIDGISDCKKVTLTFASKEDHGAHQVRACAPMDFGPRARAHDQSDCYHFHDYESEDGPHTLSLLPEQVVSIAETDELFDPAEFITWETNWHHPRDWGKYS